MALHCQLIKLHCKHPCPGQRGWNQVVFRVPSNPSRSVSLHFCDFSEICTNSGSAARGQVLLSPPLPWVTSTHGQHNPSMQSCTSVTEKAKASNFHAVSELSTLGFAATSELQFFVAGTSDLVCSYKPTFLALLDLGCARGRFPEWWLWCHVGQMAKDPFLKALLTWIPLPLVQSTLSCLISL